MSLLSRGEQASGRSEPHRPQSLADLLTKVVRDLHLGPRLAEQKACELWPEVVGDYIAKNTRVCTVDRGKLMVWVKTAAWQNEISLRRGEIIRKLNKALKEHVVEDILFVSEK
ncbi:MAG: DUF721 domain-containing protein [Candidatus Latescibacterota bacterium]